MERLLASSCRVLGSRVISGQEGLSEGAKKGSSRAWPLGVLVPALRLAMNVLPRKFGDFSLFFAHELLCGGNFVVFMCLFYFHPLPCCQLCLQALLIQQILITAHYLLSVVAGLGESRLRLEVKTKAILV